MGIKIFSPLSYSEGKLYGISPSTPSATTLDLSFARNTTNKTRINNRGILQDVPYNLLSYSEEFDNTAWTKTQAAVTPNAVQPPNNPNYTADLIYPTGSTAFIQTSGTTTTASGGTYYFSVYAKSAGKNFIMLNPSGGTTGVWYNLSTGVVGTQSAGNGYILNMGNGWYYCVWFGTLSGALQPIIRISDADNSTSNTPSTTTGVYLWGAQLSQSTAVQPYFKTTNRLNVPSIDYSLSTGGSGCLLMEPQRTNLVLYSEDFTNVAWQVSTAGLTITNNTYISPSGSLNGNRVTSSGTGARRLRQNLTNTPNTPFTFSCYVRADTGSELIAIWINDGITSPAVSSVFQTVGTSWVRISCFGTTSASATELSVLIGLHNSTTLGDYKNGSFGLWGAQLEVGAYPTSYIPTTAASATRAADSFTRNSLFSNNYVTAAGGTWFVDLDNNVARVRDAADVGLFLGDTATGTTNSFCINTPSGSSRMEIDSYVNGSASTLHVTATDRTRAAIKWNGSTADVFVNGTKVVSGTTFTGTSLEFMGLNVKDTPKYIRGMWLAPVPLTDADLISATKVTDIPQWFKNPYSEGDANVFVKNIQANLTYTQTQTINVISILSGTSNTAFTLANNGNLYSMPSSSQYVIEFNPNNKSITTFGTISSGTDKWSSNVLAINGKIYSVPYNSNTILEVDPISKNITTFGNIIIPTVNTEKYVGAVLGSNGKIYGIPLNADRILEIDPISQTISTFGTLNVGSYKFFGGVLAPNGKIYGIPFVANTILEIDPINRTINQFGNFPGNQPKWAGGVLAPNGKIYGIPYTSSSILEIDPITKTTSLFGNLTTNANKWSGGALASNGKIYATPANSTSILEIDPITKTTSLFGNFVSSYKWSGFTLAFDGKLYTNPSSSLNQILEVLNVVEGLDINIPLSRHLNKF